MELIAFVIFSVFSVLFALGTMLFRNILHSVLSLVGTFLCLAILFLFFGAEFVAVSQIMVYAGGILILIVFGLMLTSKIGQTQSNQSNTNHTISVVLSGTLFLFFAYKVCLLGLEDVKLKYTPVKEIGYFLLTEHVFAFEAITILLLVTLVGASLISKGK